MSKPDYHARQSRRALKRPEEQTRRVAMAFFVFVSVFSIAMVFFVLSVTKAWAADAPADFSGMWVPAGGSAPLTPDNVKLTAEGKAALEQFDPRQHDSTLFCLPYGTPRNVLATAPYPIEILQRPERITIIFDRLGDVRRIFTDGRGYPRDNWPTWLGYSIGAWEDDVLLVDSFSFLGESVLSDQGLPHSERMTVSERISLVRQNGEDMLRDEITINDPVMYAEPIKAVRLFRRVPYAQMSEGSSLCLMDQWRQQLEARNKALREEGRAGQGGAQ